MIPQVVTDFVLQWVLPFSIVFGSFFLLVRMINLAYRRTDLDRLYSIGISIGIFVGFIFIVYVILKNAGYLDKMHSIWNLIYNSAFVVGIRLKLNAMFGNYWIIIINFLKKWVPIYFRAICIVYPVSTMIAIWSLTKRISFARGANILLSYAVLHPLFIFKYILGYATPSFDYINSRLFVAQLKENLNDSYIKALQERDDRGEKFKDGAGGTSATQTKKQVALAMRYTRSKLETIGGNRNNRHAKLVIKRSREMETDNMIQSNLKGFGSRINVPFVQFQDSPIFNVKENGFVFDSDVNYHAGSYLGSWQRIFVNPLSVENKKTNGGKGTLTTFLTAYVNTIKYLLHLTPYSMYDRVRRNAKIKFSRDTTIEKAKFIARQNMDLSILPAPIDEDTGNTIEEAKKEALEVANSRINDIASALNANKIRGVFDSVVVGGTQAIYKFTLPKDPDLPNDFKDVQKKMANMLKIPLEPIITLSSGILSISVANQRPGAEKPINIPVDFAEMIRNRKKGMNTLVSGVIGVDALGNDIYVELGGLYSHMAIFGATGMGKSVTLFNLAYSIMDSVTPEDVKFIFLDGKGNTFEFMRNDGENPNPFVYCQPADGSGDIDYLRAVVRHIEWVIRKRMLLFKERKVQKLSEFNEKYPDEKLYQIVIFFDEVSAVTDLDDNLKGDEYRKFNIKSKLEFITKIARSVGVILILANQTARKEKLDGKTMANVRARLSLGLSEPIESEIALPDTGIDADKIKQPGEFYLLMGLPEHGNSPYLTESQTKDLNDELTRVFGRREYVFSREEILEQANEEMEDMMGYDYTSPDESELPSPDSTLDDVIKLCRKYPDWAIENADTAIFTDLDIFTKGVPNTRNKFIKKFKLFINELKAQQVQDKEKAKYENDKHAGNAKSTTSGVDGDFASLTKDKISEGIK